MESSGSSSFGLPGRGVILVHGWYRGAASVDLRKEASLQPQIVFLPTVLPDDDAEFFGSIEGCSLRASLVAVVTMASSICRLTRSFVMRCRYGWSIPVFAVVFASSAVQAAPLVVDGKPAAIVAVAADAGEWDALAVKDLIDYVEQMSGATLEQETVEADGLAAFVKKARKDK